jgi:hypothetical protein
MHLSVRALPLACLAVAGCGAAATGSVTASPAARIVRWSPYASAHRPLDLVNAGGGTAVLVAGGRLFQLRPSGKAVPFDPAYRSPGGEEPYVAVPVAGHRGCSFGAGAIYAIRLTNGRGVTQISASGHVRRFATLTAPGLIDGIAFDDSGSFGYRLLVTINHGSTTTVDSVGCHGTVNTITTTAPRVEGGIAVAPGAGRFGRFSGDLIAPDETGGRIFAITPTGKSLLVANSGLPHGGDIGVESEAFVPSLQNFDALVADRRTPGNPHPGDDVVLRLGSSALRAAGVKPYDLLVATEGGALTDAIRCGPGGCQVHHVADGPSQAHGEGHIAFVTR